MSSIERRHQSREELNLDVTMSHPRHGTLRGRLCNYSNGGMYVSLNTDPGELYGVITLRIYRDDVMMVVRGLVVHRHGTGIGIMIAEPVTVVELYGGTTYEVSPRMAVA